MSTKNGHIPVLNRMTKEEADAENRILHPEWFDENGNQLPTAITGHFGPGGQYINLPGNSDKEKGIKRMPEEMGVIIPPNFKPTVRKPIPSVRCSAMTRGGNGKRCGRWAIRGGNVCPIHGGKAKQNKEKAQAVVEAARLRVLGLADDAVDVIYNLLTADGVPSAIKLKAAQDVLDRIGVKAAQEVSVEVVQRNPAEEVQKRLERLARVEVGPGTADVVEAVIEAHSASEGGSGGDGNS